MLAFDPEVDDFRVRKQCLEDAEVLAFQRQHPKLYWMLTDRKMVQEPRVRAALTGLIHVRNKVDCGELQDGQDGEAMATRTVPRGAGGHARGRRAGRGRGGSSRDHRLTRCLATHTIFLQTVTHTTRRHSHGLARTQHGP